MSEDKEVVLTEEEKAVFKAMNQAERQMKLHVIADPNDWDQNDLIEKVLHYMRFDPKHLFDMHIEELHQLEMALAAHISFVRSKENYWATMVDMVEREYNIKVNYHCSKMDSKQFPTAKERKAVVENTSEEIKTLKHNLDLYRAYTQITHKISDTLMQADNSLKKTLDIRKIEYTQTRSHA